MVYRSFFRMVDLSMANCLFVITRGLTWGFHPVVMVTGWQASGPTTGPGASVAWPLKLGMLNPVDRLKHIDQTL
jgi:hypothetical protein